MKALVSIYNPADLFPPTLNAIRHLSQECEQVVLVTTSRGNHGIEDLPSNVQVVDAVSHSGTAAKSGMLNFLRYSLKVWRVLSREKFDIALMYDPHAWLAVSMSRYFFISQPKLSWYHNHDVYELKTQRRFSAAWFALKQEQKEFRRLDVFSLPSNERKKYFPLNEFKGAYFFIPNYPSAQFMRNYPLTRKNDDVIRLIYQGRVSEGHGLEQIIDILQDRVNGKQLQLVLKGFINPAYQEQLAALAKKNNVSAQIEFHGPSAYKEVPKLTADCQVGIAIHQKTDLMNTTLGTSSNKIYEYAALGLPVLLYDTPHFREHLSRYSWARFTDCTRTSLTRCIQEIDDQFVTISRQAHTDFKEQLNFESYFGQAVAYCKQLLRPSITVPAS